LDDYQYVAESIEREHIAKAIARRIDMRGTGSPRILLPGERLFPPAGHW
jgi:hypothetical protein